MLDEYGGFARTGAGTEKLMLFDVAYDTLSQSIVIVNHSIA